MIVFIDDNYRCHLTDDGTRKAVETEQFDGKCQVFVEGYRLVPYGESWTREDGVVFDGQMITPVSDYASLQTAQEQYELDQAQATDMAEALSILGVTE